MRKHSAYSAANWLAARRRGGDVFTYAALRLGGVIFADEIGPPPPDNGAEFAGLPWLVVRYVSGPVLTDEDAIYKDGEWADDWWELDAAEAFDLLSEEIEDVGGGVRIRGDARAERLTRGRRAKTHYDLRPYNRHCKSRRDDDGRRRERRFLQQDAALWAAFWRNVER